MTANGWTQIVLYLVVLTGLALPLGYYMAAVYRGDATWLSRIFGWLERSIYRVAGIDAQAEMNWKTYALAMLLFNCVGCLAVYALQRLQGGLPFNPQGFSAVSPDSSFNTATSFATNTNWQGYAGESTMSYLTQMAALTVQNFLSAATGMAVLVALIRGLTGKETQRLGNFWVDLTRSTLYILMPLSCVLALALVWTGVPQTVQPYATVQLAQATTYSNPVLDKDGKLVLDDKGQAKSEDAPLTEQTLALGPVASQEAIKQLGTNGGGFFNANSAHPYENPTPLSNFLEMLSILLIPAALCFTFGALVKDMRQGWAIFAAMTIIFVGALLACTYFEQSGNPAMAKAGVDLTASELQAGGNMEGKETRFGIVNSTIWAASTTCASNGSVNAMHDSFTPLGGLIPLWMIQLGEVVFGGVGSGLYGMIIFVIKTVFIAGLMVGRTPEYLGKKIEAFEVKMAALVILIPPLLVVLGTAAGVLTDAGRAGTANGGAHGFSEILYAFSSAGNNNGSAFAGLSANSVFYNLALGVAMLIGRFWLAVPVLAIAGSLGKKKIVPVGPGTLETHTPLFVFLLIGVVVLVGALAFLPALALGPIVEHLQMTQLGS